MVQQDIQINHYLHLLWKGKWLILLTTVVAMGSVIAFSQSRPPPTPSYTAIATVSVDPVGAPMNLANLTSLPASLALGGPSQGDRGVNTRLQLFESRNVMDRALAKLEEPEESAASTVIEDPVDGAVSRFTVDQVEALRAAIDVRPITNTNLLEVRARASSAELAQKRANAAIESYIDYLKDERSAAIQEALDDINGQLANLVQVESLGGNAEILLPTIGSELVDITGKLARSARDLQQLGEQQVAIAAAPQFSLQVEKKGIERVAADLDVISESIQSVREELEGQAVQKTQAASSPLRLEAQRMEDTATELDAILQDLRGVQTGVQSMDPFDVIDDVIAQAELAEDLLRPIPNDLSRINSFNLSVTTANRIAAVSDYVRTVANELDNLARTLPFRGREVDFLERERASMQSQILSYTLGLSAAITDLADVRNPSNNNSDSTGDNLDVRDQARLLKAEGDIQVGINRLTSLIGTLDSTGDVVVADEGLSTVQDWVQGSAGALRSLSENFLSLDAAPDTPGERDIASRAGREINEVALTLQIASSKIKSLPALPGNPLASARLNSAAQRLDAAQANLTGSSNRLIGITQGSSTELPDDLATIQGRVQTEAYGLWQTLEALEGGSHVPSTALHADATIEAQNEVLKVSRSLDVAGRQLQGLLAGVEDPLLVGELAPLADRLVTAQVEVNAILVRLDSIIQNNQSVGNAVDELARAHERVGIAAISLIAAAGTAQQLQESGSEVTPEEVIDLQEQIDVGVAILTRVIGNLSSLTASETDLLRYGRFAVLEGRITEAQTQAAGISSQLRQLKNGQGPSYLEMRRLQQQLELTLLQPQDTGITVVDSAVSPQRSRKRTLFEQIRVVLGGMAGLFLGSVAVLAKGQVDQTVRTRSTLRDQLEVMSLGVVPRGKFSGSIPPNVASAQAPGAFMEALQLLSTSLQSSLSDGVRSLLITSPGAREGKTMLAVNLAQVLSQHGRRVLLVDANLRKPDVARALGLTGAEGLADALAQRRDPAAYIVQTGDFAVLPGGSAPGGSAPELLASPAMAAFLQQAQREYELVLVDGPPALGFAETKALAKGINGAILVVKCGATKMEAVKSSRGDLEAANISLVGSVLNFASSDECGHLRHERYSQSGAGLGERASRILPAFNRK